MATGDLGRVIERGGSTFAVIAEASGAPFERVTPALSRAMLDAVEAAVDGGVNAAAAAARAAVAAAGDAEAGDAEAEGWLLIAQVYERRIALRWAGLAEAWLVRGDQVIEHARGHSTRYQGPPIAGDFATRGLGAGWKGFEATMWRAEAGMRLVCGNASVARLGSEALRGLAGAGEVAAAARALVDAAIARDAERHALAIVLEVA